MKTLLASLLFSGLALAQPTLQASVSAATVRPGQSLTVTLTYSGASPALAGLQWTLGLPLGLSGVPVLNTAIAALSKSISVGSSGFAFIWGLNLAVIPVGPVVTVPITIPANAAPGNYNVTLANAVGATPAGIQQTVAGGNTSFAVLNPFDIDGNGTITAADVTAMVNQVASGNCTVDLIGNGQCNVVQVILEVIGWAAAGSHP